jgi:hypothetical protein
MTRVTQCMAGRALQESSSSCLIAVLHQCIRPLVGTIELRAIMGISARAISLAVRPLPSHLGHQCSHALGRPILHLVWVLSQTSAGKSYRSGYVIASSSFRAVPKSSE